MNDLLASVSIGAVSGVLSGAFGIGGGIITTPAIRLILGAPALVAVGTPLPVIFPSALAGAVSYARNGIADVRAGVICGVSGSLTAVLGAWATRLVGGDVVLIATAVLILYTAGDTIAQVLHSPRIELAAGEEADAFHAASVELVAAEQTFAVAALDESLSAVAVAGADSAHTVPRASLLPLAAIGAITGLYAGFLGLGGGFVLVPLLTRWRHFDMKRAIATSLVAITILSVPGTITHALLGHIDWRIAASLAVGVVPGALLGARITLGAADRTVRLAFAALLVIVGAWLAVSELTGLLG